MTPEQMKARIAELEAEKLARETKGFGLKVSLKGAISAYGLGRLPVTLYAGQWISLLRRTNEVLAFLKANAANPALSFKTPEQKADFLSAVGQ